MSLQVRDASFEGRYHRGRRAGYDFVQRGIDIVLNGQHFFRSVLGLGRMALHPQIPGVCKHLTHHGEQVLRWLDPLKESFKTTFQVSATDGLSSHFATLGLAKVIWVLGAIATFGPGSRHRIAATRAIDEATQRKVRVDIFALGRDHPSFFPLLDSLKGRK